MKDESFFFYFSFYPEGNLEEIDSHKSCHANIKMSLFNEKIEIKKKSNK